MNSVSLIGRLTRDPDVRYSAGSQTAVAKFTLAVDRHRNVNEGEPTADFIRITCFGKTAELVEKYVRKGYMVGVLGRIQTGSYDKDGQRIYTTDVIADRVEFLDRGNSSSEGSGNYGSSNNTDQLPPGIATIDDDDIPF